MDYFTIYTNIIKRAKSRPKDFLGHNHHIIPKSIAPELRDEPWNMSNLTSREHIICHLLLTRIIDKSEELYPKIATALMGMCNHPQTSRHAKPWLKKYAIALYSKYHPNLGKPLSEVQKQALSKANKGRPMPEHVRKAISKANKGKTISDAHKQAIIKAHKDKPCPDHVKEKISKANKGRKLTEAQRQAISDAQKGVPLSKAHREAISKANTGRVQSESHRIKNIIERVKFSIVNHKGWAKTPCNKYRVEVRQYGKSAYLGTFNTSLEARKTWLNNRLEHLAQLQCRLYGALGGV